MIRLGVDLAFSNSLARDKDESASGTTLLSYFLDSADLYTLTVLDETLTEFSPVFQE